jgi:hypothetical protein
MAEMVQSIRARRMKMAMTTPKEMATLLAIDRVSFVGRSSCGVFVAV